MYRLRGTAKLLARLNVASEREPAETTTRLGDWYANHVHVGRVPLVLAVSDRTLLPVVLRARELRWIVPRLGRQFVRVDRAIGAPREAIVREVAAMGEATVCKTASRQVLGCMTEFAFMMEAFTKDNPVSDEALVELAVRLAKSPCSPIAMVFPCDAAITALGGADLPILG